ncbi:MAG: ABC transporter permease [Candidatus Aminicenantaceae bacterium]
MFDLEKSIKDWRRSLNLNESLEDGAKTELESHLRDKIEYLLNQGRSEEEAFAEAVAKIGTADTLGTEYFKATTRHLSGRPPWQKSRWLPPLLSNYIKIGLRKVRRQKVYSFINIVGLAVGLACCAVIILYVTNELTYDSYHPDAERVFRIGTHSINQVAESRSATTPAPLALELKASYPQVEHAVRIIPPFENSQNTLVVRGDKRFFETRVFFADPEVFEVLHIPFINGAPKGALEAPNSVVLSEGMAAKYFGDESALGQTIQIEIDYDIGNANVRIEDYHVTGIVRGAPINTHFKYDMLLSASTINHFIPTIDTDWVHWHGKFTYVKLLPQTDPTEFEGQIQRAAAIAAQKYTERFGREMQLNEYFLEPITRIHMYSQQIMRQLEAPGNWYYVYIYSITAFLILLIGCMNFINLSAALSTTRTQEVGLRRVVGAQTRQLINQFLGESFLITVLAFVAAFGLMWLLLIPFNQMAGTELTLAGLRQPVVLASLLGLLLFVGIVSGSYPAFILTAFKPAAVLQGKSSNKSRGTLIQKGLVVGQFAISIFLVICTLTVFKQLDFMRGQALGFKTEQKLLLRVKSNLNHLRRDYEEIKKSFMLHPSIIGATVSSTVPGDGGRSGYYLTQTNEDFRNAPWLSVITQDYDFMQEYGIRVVAGRGFDRSRGNDEQESYLINLAAVEALGFATPEEALGQSFQASYHRQFKRIVGIVDNFHYRGMRDLVEPMVLDIEDSLFTTITLSIRIENMQDIMKHVRAQWEEHFPGVPFEYSFLNENFDREYRYEAQMSRLLGIITTLGFAIACLGLFGLASFVVRYRVKEIGIRKVLGATTTDIVIMLSKKFIWLILGAIVIASPLAFYAMNRWLQDFAYRIELTGIVFLVAAAGAMAIALATVGFQGMRAASANPVNSLRDE